MHDSKNLQIFHLILILVCRLLLESWKMLYLFSRVIPDAFFKVATPLSEIFNNSVRSEPFLWKLPTLQIKSFVVILSLLFFLSSSNIAGCIIREYFSDFRCWWKDGTKKFETEWLLFISISFSVFSFFAFIFVQLCFTSVDKTDWRLYISINGEYFVEECRLTRWANRIRSMICDHISGLSSNTFTKEFFIVPIWRSTNLFSWG